MSYSGAPAAITAYTYNCKVVPGEDWEHAEAIFDALGPESLDWQGIAGLLEQQPALRQRMALLNREAAGR